MFGTSTTGVRLVRLMRIVGCPTIATTNILNIFLFTKLLVRFYSI